MTKTKYPRLRNDMQNFFPDYEHAMLVFLFFFFVIIE